MEDFFENNGTLSGTNGTLSGTNGAFWEHRIILRKTREVWRHCHFSLHTSFYSSICSSFANKTLWQKDQTYLRTIFWGLAVFEKDPRPLGKPFMKTTTDLVPVFSPPQQVWKLMRKSCSDFGWKFIHTRKGHWSSKHHTQTKYKVMASQVPVVMSHVADRKCWKSPSEFARGTWPSCKWLSGKWCVPSKEFTYSFFQMLKTCFRWHVLSLFWGMLKTLLI